MEEYKDIESDMLVVYNVSVKTDVIIATIGAETKNEQKSTNY